MTDDSSRQDQASVLGHPRVVTMLRLPLSGENLLRLQRALAVAYGPGLRVGDYGDDWLAVLLPEPPRDVDDVVDTL
jgi:hypothetical protein